MSGNYPREPWEGPTVALPGPRHGHPYPATILTRYESSYRSDEAGKCLVHESNDSSQLFTQSEQRYSLEF